MAKFKAGNNRRRDPRPRTWRDLVLVVIGALIVALGFNLLLRAGGIAPGGVPGASLVLQRMTGVEPAIWQAVLNGGLLVFGGLMLGKAFLVRCALGSALVPGFVALTRDLTPLTTNPLLAAICGGVVVGAGIGLVFLGRGSVGGFSTVALVLHRRFDWPVDRSIMVMDGGVILAAAFVFPTEQALCAIVAAALLARTVRRVLTGGDHAKLALVVTRRAEAVQDAVLHEIDLGLTRLQGRGGYTDEARDLLMVVMRPGDVPRLKRVVRELDPSAFVTLADASEVLGYGFKTHA
ncbi:YitT family protein [Synoicihabitans lomoniglobus]|uniref:YitT family protein n=1 Tax=Synoicihabitans lomoniglobus TaxID=2909285 RepID=A0AAE9ZW74_9BACT|nr:YitT family protein [Opitutaceae bacterium LMO-M01]WED64314.1 YitT family protein [Opitutaceae bacterium LMO-M01]